MSDFTLGDVTPLDLATLTWPAGTPRAGRPIPVYGYSIRLPDGIVLFDTGVGEGSAEVEREWRPRRRSLEKRLAGIGRKASDVVGIVVCHLHFDHCGNDPLFPGIPIYTQRAEYEASRAPDYTVPEWVEFPGAEYKLLEGDAEPWPEVHVLSTPGHTPGHQSLLVDTHDGGVLLTGQAVYDLAEFDGRAPLESSDPGYAGSVERLRSLKPRRVYVSHDDGRGDYAGSRPR